ncbi:hypothetical protein Clacol_001534 [Clathrus columnatus]|uniref:Uncharacterized protein n=1 Tax=Clathrus columnatus TaxID=1419009 RepID=A0AAV5A3U8_9AGAM|nr:hypothetical protein Clacol_001534 [Clathrus columnatus]
MEQGSSSFSHANISTVEKSVNELPAYHEIVQDPNSRAAERYADDTPEKRLERQLKGWGPQIDYETQDDCLTMPAVMGNSSLHRTQTLLSNSSPLQETQPIAHITHCEALLPSHAKLCTFGSRFIPHSEYPILSLLPISNEKRLLIGHSAGLCVLDMDSEMTDLNTKEPRRYDIFYGEGIYQMDILELEENYSSTAPKGIVLALIGRDPEGRNDRENREVPKTIRMYSLASLAKLAQWACDTKGKEPLDLSQRDPPPCVGQEKKKHKFRSKNSSVDCDGLAISYPSSSSEPSTTSTHIPITSDKNTKDPKRLPLHWAGEYTPLATPGSRLDNQSVLFYTLQRCKERSRVTTRLAVATKQSILLYETEFYIPAIPKSITFVQQRPLLSDRRLNSLEDSSRGLTVSWLRSSQINSGAHYGQLSLFVTFDKKACLIRILDSSVTELEMWADSEAKHSRRASSLSLSPGGQGFRLPRSSFEGLSLMKESRGSWIPPAEISLPSGKASSTTDVLTVYFLTRGQHTHIVPAPLIMPSNIYAPLKILEWGIQPTYVVPRLCQHPVTGEHFLQVTILAQEGLEIQECSLSFLNSSSLRKEQRETTVVAQADVGPGGAGFLRMGGYWNRQGREKSLPPLPLHRDSSRSTLDTFDLHVKRDREQGFYAWARKGYNDWRVFWLGGDAEDGPPPKPNTP